MDRHLVTEGCSLRGYAAVGIAGCFRSIDSFVSGRSPCPLSSALPPSRRVTEPVIVRGFIATPINIGKTAIRHTINTGAASFLVLFARKRSCPDSANLSRIHREEFYGNLANSCWGKGAQDAITGQTGRRRRARQWKTREPSIGRWRREAASHC